MKSKIIVVGIVLLLAIAIVNAYLIMSSSFTLNKRIAELKELNKPAQIEIIKLEADCKDCFTVDALLQEIKSSGFNITGEKTVAFSSQEGKDLIEKYGIQKLPMIIIRGELNKTEIQDFELKKDALVFTGTGAPYTDARSGNSYGFVSLTHIVDSSCNECTPLTGFGEGLKQTGVFIKNERTVQYNSEEGKELIKKFDIKHIPALLISQDIDSYPDVQQQLLTLKAKEKDGFYAIHSTVAPYRNLSSNKIVGPVEFIMLKDDSCKECYNVTVNQQILKRFGMYLKKESVYDVSSKEGKDLLQKYNITRVPMILVSPEASVYSSFVSAWDEVGTVEKDGWYVMRDPDVIGTVKDLATGQLIQTQGS